MPRSSPREGPPDRAFQRIILQDLPFRIFLQEGSGKVVSRRILPVCSLQEGLIFSKVFFKIPPSRVRPEESSQEVSSKEQLPRWFSSKRISPMNVLPKRYPEEPLLGRFSPGGSS
jgi:hypothetical protein